MHDEASDAEIVQRIQSGDRDAEAEICRRMGPRIRLYGLRHLRSPGAADDLVQQVLVTTIEALRAGRLREDDKLPHFVLGTCRMTVLDIRRTPRRRAALLETYAADLVPHVADTPWIDREHLTRCLQALPERERTVVTLTFYDERDSTEVAEALGVSRANVRVIRHRALRQLRGCMEGRT